MDYIEVTARHKRRRAGIDFPKGQKVKVSLEGKTEDEIKELITKLESDPVLKIHLRMQAPVADDENNDPSVKPEGNEGDKKEEGKKEPAQKKPAPKKPTQKSAPKEPEKASEETKDNEKPAAN